MSVSFIFQVLILGFLNLFPQGPCYEYHVIQLHLLYGSQCRPFEGSRVVDQFLQVERRHRDLLLKVDSVLLNVVGIHLEETLRQKEQCLQIL